MSNDTYSLFDFGEDRGSIESYDDLIVTLDDLRGAVVWGTDWTAETIVRQIKKGLIDLQPKFQRREAWSDRRKSTFIESVITGMPIPQIILAERKDKKGSYIVIDGKQRLISLRRFFSDVSDNEFAPLKLQGLTLLKQLNGKTYSDILSDPVLNDYISQVENQPIRTVVIKNWPNEEFLYSVFFRLNTGSLPLSTQELRQALHPGPFLDFCDEFSEHSTEIQRILHIQSVDYRMRDIELVVRFYSFKLNIESYPGNLKKFFDDSVKNLNESWTDSEMMIRTLSTSLTDSIAFTFEVFGDDAFRKWKNRAFDSRFNRAIYDIMVYYFSNQSIRTSAGDHRSDIKSAFISLCESDATFINSFEVSTKNVRPTAYRFRKWGETLSQVLGMDISIPTLNYE